MHESIKTTTKVGDTARISIRRFKSTTNRFDFHINLVKSKRFIEVGCVDMLDIYDYDNLACNNKHLFYSMSKVAEYGIGLDINKEGINTLKAKGLNVEYCDITKDNPPCLDEKYDYLVLSHVIEHVPDIYNFLKYSIEKVNFNRIVVSVPSAYKSSVLNHLIFFKEEAISNDHYYTFTPFTIIKLLESVGIEIIEVYLESNDDIKIRFGKRYIIRGLIRRLFVKKFLNKGFGDIIVVGKKSSNTNLDRN